MASWVDSRIKLFQNRLLKDDRPSLSRGLCHSEALRRWWFDTASTESFRAALPEVAVEGDDAVTNSGDGPSAEAANPLAPGRPYPAVLPTSMSASVRPPRDDALTAMRQAQLLRAASETEPEAIRGHDPAGEEDDDVLVDEVSTLVLGLDGIHYPSLDFLGVSTVGGSAPGAATPANTTFPWFAEHRPLYQFLSELACVQIAFFSSPSRILREDYRLPSSARPYAKLTREDPALIPAQSSPLITSRRPSPRFSTRTGIFWLSSRSASRHFRPVFHYERSSTPPPTHARATSSVDCRTAKARLAGEHCRLLYARREARPARSTTLLARLRLGSICDLVLITSPFDTSATSLRPADLPYIISISIIIIIIISLTLWDHSSLLPAGCDRSSIRIQPHLRRPRTRGPDSAGSALALRRHSRLCLTKRTPTDAHAPGALAAPGLSLSSIRLSSNQHMS
ncbi:hypothetical protein V8E36_009835 [Tilletia maclaganii]